MEQLNNPFFLWYVYFIFGPAFLFGWAGLAGMALAHALVFSGLMWLRRKRIKEQTLPRRILGAIGLLIASNAIVGILMYLSVQIFTLINN